MSRATLKAIQAAAGNAGEAVYVDDVFSTYLYTGNGSTQTITNGIDLDGEGGLVWIKSRDNSTFANSPNVITDTVTGLSNYLITNQTTQQQSWSSDAPVATSSGFTLPTNSQVPYTNYLTGSDYASWTFRKQPGFFDVVTYTGNGVAGTEIPHNLGSVPGLIIVKLTSGSGGWIVFHRSLGNTKYLQLNSTNAEATASWPWNNTSPTSTHFTVGTGGNINASGSTYVAYLFAHDAQDFGTDSDESIIKCGSYTGNGSTTGPVIDLGFEPQWLLIKGVTSGSAYDWRIHDVMRGFTADGNGAKLEPNTFDAEDTAECRFRPLATGFQPTSGAAVVNGSGATYIYVAIRRPHKPASEFAATDLFDPVVGQTSGKPNYSSSTGVVDALFRSVKTSDSGYPLLASRLTFPNYLITHSTAAESTFPLPTTNLHFAMNDGWGDNIGGTSTNVFVHMFRRAPGFFDVVAFTASSAGDAVAHNLGVAPELIIVKGRNATQNWYGYSGTLGAGKYLTPNTASAATTGTEVWYGTEPTSTEFTIGAYLTAFNYIAYLFATVPGISKVGSYSGTGSNVDVNCGFTSGARFVLVKRTDSTGGWYVWDSANGITAGNDPYILLNSSAGQTTGTDYIDPLSSGFTITSTAPAELNASGGTYIFLAIA